MESDDEFAHYNALSKEANKKVDELCKKAVLEKWNGPKLYKNLISLSKKSKKYQNVTDTEVIDAIYCETGIDPYDD